MIASDSGVDSGGNDSNDSFILENRFNMDCDSNFDCNDSKSSSRTESTTKISEDTQIKSQDILVLPHTANKVKTGRATDVRGTPHRRAHHRCKIHKCKIHKLMKKADWYKTRKVIIKQHYTPEQRERYVEKIKQHFASLLGMDLKKETPFSENKKIQNSLSQESEDQSELTLVDITRDIYRRLINQLEDPAAPPSSLLPENSDIYKNYIKLLISYVMTNSVEGVTVLLQLGMSPNCYDWCQRTPLHIACSSGATKIVKLLLDYGADPNFRDRVGNTALHLAACSHRIDVITLLLQAGARVDELDRYGHSPLQMAITKFNLIRQNMLPHPELKEKVCQVIAMLTEYMKRSKESPDHIDPELLSMFESQVRISDSATEVVSSLDHMLGKLSLQNH